MSRRLTTSPPREACLDFNSSSREDTVDAHFSAAGAPHTTKPCFGAEKKAEAQGRQDDGLHAISSSCGRITYPSLLLTLSVPNMDSLPVILKMGLEVCSKQEGEGRAETRFQLSACQLHLSIQNF